MTLSPDDPRAVAVCDAIRAGDIAKLEHLLDEHDGLAQARIGDRDCSRTLPLVATDWPGHFPDVATTIAVLVAAGADPRARFVGRHQETPLHWAASSDDVDALEALLEAGVDIDADGGVMAGGSPLEDARIFGQWNAARRLVERGATTVLDDEAALGLLDRVRARFAANSDRPTPDETNRSFWYACHGGRLSTARFLLDQGAELDWTPPWEALTPLEAALRSHEHNDTDAGELVDWLRSLRPAP